MPGPPKVRSARVDSIVGVPNPTQRRTLLLRIAAPILLVLSLLSWGLSTAVGGTPDDDFHLSSIWCGHGENQPGCAAAAEPDERRVGSSLIVDAVCFAFNEDASAACQGRDFNSGLGVPLVTDRGNFAGLYPPVFYWTMSWFAGHDIERSVLLMRAANAVLFVGLVTALFWLLPLGRRQTLVWSLAVTLVPLGLFLIPSTNPSGWAVLSAGTLWISLLGYFETSGWRRFGLATIATISTVIGAGARADAALFAILAIALVVLLTFERSRRYAITAILPVVLVLVAAAFALTSSQAGAVTEGLAPVSDGLDLNPFTLAIANLVELPALWAGIFGSWPLGWLDTGMPAGVWVPAVAAFCGAVFLGLNLRVPRKGTAISLVSLALVAFPLVLLVRSQSTVGANFQPRYLLPLMIILAGLLLLRQSGTRVALAPAATWLVVVGLAAANAIALHTNIRRYTTGADVAGVDLDTGREWWWNIPIGPMATWIIGSVAFAALLVILNTRTWNRETPYLRPARPRP